MSSDAVVKSVGKKLRYYFEVKRLEEGFDLSGVNRPILDHPRLRPRKTLQCAVLKDVPLKHHFRSPSIRVKLTQFPGVHAPGSPRERRVKRALESYITKSEFVPQTSDTDLPVITRPVRPWHPNRQHPYLSSYSYIQTTRGRKLRPEASSALHTNNRSTKRRSRSSGLKGACPVIRSAPPHFVTKKQADRLVTVASKILVANETLELKDSKPRPPNGTKPQSAPAPFETQRSLPYVETEARPKTSRGFHRKNRYTDDGRDSAYTTDRTSPVSDEYQGGKGSQGSVGSGSDKSSGSETELSPRPPAAGKPASRRSRPMSARTLHQNQIMDISHPLSGQVGIELGVQTRGTVAIQTDSRGDLEEKHVDEGDHLVRAGPACEYRVYVRTGKRIGASTKAQVRVTLYGEHGRSQEFLLKESQRHKIKFQKGHEDLFSVHSPHVGRLKGVKIGHDRPELMFAWFLEGVTVEDVTDKRVYECPCERWLSGQDGDKRTYRVLPVDRDRVLLEDSEEESGSDVSYIKRYGQDTASEGDESPRNSPDSVQARRSEHSSSSSSSGSESDSETDTESSSSEGTPREVTIPVKPPSTDVKVTQTVVQAKANQDESRAAQSKIETSPGRKQKDDFFDQRPAGPVYTFRTGTSVGSHEDADTEKPELSVTESDSETSRTSTSDYADSHKAAVILPKSTFPVIAEEEPKQSVTFETVTRAQIKEERSAAPVRVVPRIAVDTAEDPAPTGDLPKAGVVEHASLTGSSRGSTTSGRTETEPTPVTGQQSGQTLTVQKAASSRTTDGTTTTETGSGTDRTTTSGSGTDRTKSGSGTDRTKSGSGTDRSSTSTTTGSGTDRTTTDYSTDTRKTNSTTGRAVGGEVTGAPSTTGQTNKQQSTDTQAVVSDTEDSDSDSSSSSGSGTDSDSDSDADTPRPQQAQSGTTEILQNNGDSQLKEQQIPLPVESLHEAAKGGKLDTVKQILQARPDKKHDLNEVGWTALHVAASEGHVHVVEWLGQTEDNLNRDTPTGYSAIHLAALHGHVNTIQVLSSLGAMVSCQTTDHQTPLHLAALGGHLESVKWLIAHGVDAGAKDDSDRRAVDLAEENEHYEVVEYLRLGEEGLRTAPGVTSHNGKPDQPVRENGTMNSVNQNQNRSAPVEQTSKPNSPEKTEEDLEEKRLLYEEQQNKMDKSGLSFLDSIRQELDQV